MEDGEVFEGLLARARLRWPGIRLRAKEDSLLMRLTGRLFFWVEWERFWVFFAWTVYAPREALRRRSRWSALAHELTHAEQVYQHPVRHMLGYAAPQVFALFALFSLVAIWHTSYWLLALSALGFLAPWPSPGRVKAEVEAYGMSLRCYEEGYERRYQRPFETARRWRLAARFAAAVCSGSYYWAGWRRGRVTERIVDASRSGRVDRLFAALVRPALEESSEA